MDTEASSRGLTLNELVGLVAAALTAVVIVATVVVTGQGNEWLIFELPAVAFAAVAGAATSGLARGNSQVDFRRALWIAAGAGLVAVVVTSLVVWWIFTPRMPRIFGNFLTMMFVVHTLPVALIYLCGAATTSGQRTVLVALIAAVPLALLIWIGRTVVALPPIAVYSANLVLGLPLAVLARYSSE